MRKNDPWKDELWWDPSCGAGVLSDDDTENRVRQLDRTPEWREDEETAAPHKPAPSPVPSANGTPKPERQLTGMQFRPRPPDPVTGEIFLDVGPDLGGLLDDMGWFVDESWNGRWFPFMGKYVAIVNKTHVGTDDDYTALLERAARECGVDPERVLIEYIPPDIFTEG